jgi:hypothetical protein
MLTMPATCGFELGQQLRGLLAPIMSGGGIGAAIIAAPLAPSCQDSAVRSRCMKLDIIDGFKATQVEEPTSAVVSAAGTL